MVRVEKGIAVVKRLTFSTASDTQGITALRSSGSFSLISGQAKENVTQTLQVTLL
jgi:hypothetical protein